MDLKLSVMAIEPWGMLDSSGKASGIYVELSEALAKEAGFNPVIEVVTYNRVIYDMENGNSVFCFMTQNPEIVNSAKNIGIIRQLDVIVLFDKKYKFTKLSDLEGFTGATLLGVLNYPAFDNNNKILKNPVKTPEQQIEMLQAKRVDFIQGVREATYYALRQIEKKHGKKIEISVPLILSKVDAYIWVSNKHFDKDFNKKLNEAAKRLKNKGIIDQIFNKYIK